MNKIDFNDNDKTAILDIISYQPDDRHRACITLIEPSLDVEFESPTASLGNFRVLPCEIFDWVIKHSTMHAVSSLRAVNRRMRLLVDTTLPYKRIISNAPHVRATLERTGVAPHFTVEEVFWILTRPACRVCGDLGLYLWIPDLERCCYNCLREEPDLMPMSERDARAAYGLTARQMGRLPVMISLPGNYKVSTTSRRKTSKFVSETRARQLGCAVHGGDDGLSKYIASSNTKAKAAYDKRLAKRSRPMSHDSHGRVNNTVDSIERYLVSVYLPYLDLESYTSHTGRACVGCRIAVSRGTSLPYNDQTALIRRCGKVYTEEGLWNHFKECAAAQDLWRTNQVHRVVSDRVH